MSATPPFAPLPDENSDEQSPDQQPDPFGEKTDTEGGDIEGGDPAEESVSDHPTDDPDRPSNPA
jgi:hypothetical protein